MRHDYDIWLYAIGLSGFVGLWVQARLPFSWVGPSFLRYVLLVLIAGAGLATPYSVPCLIAGSIAWALFVIYPILMSHKLARHLSLMEIEPARKCANKLRLLYGGKSPLFWWDTIDIYAAYARGDEAAAEALISKWEAQKLPSTTRASLT
ncbi:MAG: hypothetical protein ACRD3W_04580, partial [Terriglobales bacterium]